MAKRKKQTAPLEEKFGIDPRSGVRARWFVRGFVLGHPFADPDDTGPPTPTVSVVTGSGTVAAGAVSIRFENTHASASATVAGATLKAGKIIDFPLLNSLDSYAAVSYDATGSELTITEVYAGLTDRTDRPKTVKDEIEAYRGKLMDHLETNGIPTERTTNNHELEWLRDGCILTDELTFERECLQFLHLSKRIIERYDDKQLLEICFYANSSARLNMLQINDLAFAKSLQSKREKSGGEKSGETRKRNSESKWRNHALELAKDARAQDPKLSQDRLASRIEELWKKSVEDLPSHEQLIKFIAEKEKADELPKRRRSPP